MGFNSLTLACVSLPSFPPCRRRVTRSAWRHYRNFERLHEQLGLPLRERYTDYAETAFYSTRGLEGLSPVLGDKEPWLPSPLGPLVYTSDRFTDLPLSDRLSAAPLTRALVEFDLDEEAYAEYDCVSFEVRSHSSCAKARTVNSADQPYPQ